LRCGASLGTAFTRATGARVLDVLWIQAEIADGMSEQFIRITSKDARTLRFNRYGFEEE
jgi:hypothetical protein